MAFVPFCVTGDNQGFEEKKVDNLPSSLIRHFFSDDMLKAIYLLCMRVDIADNNDKATILAKLLPEPEWIELGTGTNRMCFQHNGMAVKIALDRRGCQDNYTEYKRSMECPQFLAKTYETNLLINIAQCVDKIDDKTQFLMHEKQVKQILAVLAESYIFNDMGFTTKNFGNWGYRPATDDDAEDGDEDLIILDYGYMYPIIGQSPELFQCPICGNKIEWNPAYTLYRCSNPQCRIEYTPTEIWRKMDMTIIDTEDRVDQEAFGLAHQNFNKLEEGFAKLYQQSN